MRAMWTSCVEIITVSGGPWLMELRYAPLHGHVCVDFQSLKWWLLLLVIISARCHLLHNSLTGWPSALTTPHIHSYLSILFQNGCPPPYRQRSGGCPRPLPHQSYPLCVYKGGGVDQGRSDGKEWGRHPQETMCEIELHDANSLTPGISSTTTLSP